MSGPNGTDHIRAALALGIEVTPAEMSRLQAAVRRGPAAALLESDPMAAAAEDDLLPELRRRLAASPDRMLAVAAGLHPAAPADLVETTMARREVQSLLASRPASLPAHVIAVIAMVGNSSQRRSIARTVSDADLLERLADDAEPVVRTSVATNASVPRSIVARLADDERQSVRAAVARRTDLDPAVLRRMAADESDLVRGSAAANKLSHGDDLAALAEDESIRVRMSVAGNVTAPADVLTALGRDAVPRVRARLAANHATPAPTLEALVADEDESVLLRVARNPSTAPELLAGLVDRAPDAALAANRSTPPALLDVLADRTVVLGAGLPEPRRNDRSVLFELARHPRCGHTLRNRLVEFGLGEPTTDAPINVRLGVVRRLAGSQPLTDDVHRRFVALDDPQVRTRLAQRTGESIPPTDVIAALEADDRLRIARALAKNASLPAEVRDRAEQRIQAAADERRLRTQRRLAERAKGKAKG